MHDRLDLERGRGYLSAAVAAPIDLCRRRCSGCISPSGAFSVSKTRKMPYIIGVAGSVAVGNRPPRALLQAMLARWSPAAEGRAGDNRRLPVPNAVLERQGLMQKKGFPESYDLPTLLSFLSDIKAGRHSVRAPVYSHLTYDIIPNEWIEVDQPDNPDRRRRQRPADRPSAARWQGRPRRLRLLRLLRLYRRPTSRCCAIGMCGASSR